VTASLQMKQTTNDITRQMNRTVNSDHSFCGHALK